MPPRANVVRRGTSKAVPIVVSAGLAIGVFCGLLFGLGTGDDNTASASTPSTSSPATKKPETAEVAEPFQPGAPKTTPPAVAKADDKKPGDAAKPDDKKPDATVAKVDDKKPAAKLVGKLTIVIKPESLLKTAKIAIDGTAIDSPLYELDLTGAPLTKKGEAQKSVKVSVKASGYKDYERSVDVIASPTADVENKVEVEMVKRASGNPPPPRPPGPPGPPGKKCKKPPCNLIDL